MRFTTKTVAGLAMCAALMLSGCQAASNQPESALGASPEQAATPVPVAVPQTEVLAAVQAATTLRELPASISNDALLATSGDYTEQWAVEGCEPRLEASRLDDIGPCTLGDTSSERTMVVIGDSAAAMWHQAFDLIGQRNGWRVIMLTKSNCGPAALTYYQWQLERPYTECDDWQDWRMAMISQEQAEIVVLTGNFDGGNQGPGRETTPEVWRDGLVETISELPEGTKTFLLGNIPRPAESPSECVASSPTDLTQCLMPSTEVLADQTPWSEAAEQTGQTYVDVDPWFCADGCPTVIADQLVYAGRFHITGEYAQYLSGSIEEAMTPALTAPR